MPLRDVWFVCHVLQPADKAVRQVLGTPQDMPPMSREPPFQIQIVPLPTAGAQSVERKLITDSGGKWKMLHILHLLLALVGYMECMWTIAIDDPGVCHMASLCKRG